MYFLIYKHVYNTMTCLVYYLFLFFIFPTDGRSLFVQNEYLVVVVTSFNLLCCNRFLVLQYFNNKGNLVD